VTCEQFALNILFLNDASKTRDHKHIVSTIWLCNVSSILRVNWVRPRRLDAVQWTNLVASDA